MFYKKTVRDGGEWFQSAKKHYFDQKYMGQLLCLDLDRGVPGSDLCYGVFTL